MNNLINVLTRTNKRPQSFRRCVDSINSQTYKNINHIVSVHNKESYEYAIKYCDNVVMIKEEIGNTQYGNNYEPYNLYVNRLIDEVKEGYIMFLDDDDFFTSRNSLKKVVPYLEKDVLLTWLVDCAKKVIPDKGALSAPVLIPTCITASSFIFHYTHKWAAKWDAVRGADYRCAQRLSWLLGHKWLHETIVTIPSASGGK
tara:strand:- start:61 stop:660 length:600 start_codon:yes stop_codon:yes gene_type:complete